MALCVNFEDGLIAVCDDCAASVLMKFARNEWHDALDEVAATCSARRCVCYYNENITVAQATIVVRDAVLVLHTSTGLAAPMHVMYDDAAGKNIALSVCAACTKLVLMQFAVNLTHGALGGVVSACPTKRCVVTDVLAFATDTPLRVQVLKTSTEYRTPFFS